MDTIGVNNYVSWYEYPGHPETIPYQLSLWLQKWYDSFKKPFFMSEYGAGSVSGLHKVSLPYIICMYVHVQFLLCIMSIYSHTPIPCRHKYNMDS